MTNVDGLAAALIAPKLAAVAFGEKVMYGKKTMGVIRSTVIVGPDGKVAKHWTKVAKAETHPEEVLAFLGQAK